MIHGPSSHCVYNSLPHELALQQMSNLSRKVSVVVPKPASDQAFLIIQWPHAADVGGGE